MTAPPTRRPRWLYPALRGTGWLLYYTGAALTISTLALLLLTWPTDWGPQPTNLTHQQWQMQHLAAIRYPALTAAAILTTLCALLRASSWAHHRHHAHSRTPEHTHYIHNPDKCWCHWPLRSEPDNPEDWY